MAKVLLPINACRACITAGPTYIITNRQLPKLGAADVAIPKSS